jgi:hypothetical protein
MDGQTSQPVNKPPATPAASPSTARYGKHFLLGYLLIIVLALTAGGVYAWQHNQVKQLKADLKESQVQLQDREAALAGFPNVLDDSNDATIDLLAFLGGDNTQCYKAEGERGYYNVIDEVDGKFAKMEYGCVDESQKSPSGSPSYILAVKDKAWKLVSPTNQWATIHGQVYPNCQMIDDNDISKKLEPTCYILRSPGLGKYKLRPNTNP